MLKKIKKLITVLLVFILIVLAILGVAFGHELFTTLPSSLAVTSHTDKAPMMVAHRGLSSLYPQNSIPAFEGAAEYGYDAYEFDVHTTKDGKWVVIHDDTVDDMTDGTGDVDTFTFEEIRQLTLDNGSNIEKYENLQIPTLEETLKIFSENNIIPVIEIKKCDTEYLPELKKILDEFGASENAIIISFTREYLEEYKKLDSDIEMMLLKGTANMDDVDWCIEHNAGLNFGYYNLYKTIKVLNYAKENGVKLASWTVDNTAYMDVLVLFGVEVITTNKILP